MGQAPALHARNGQSAVTVSLEQGHAVALGQSGCLPAQLPGLGQQGGTIDGPGIGRVLLIISLLPPERPVTVRL